MKKILIAFTILITACNNKPTIEDKINAVMNESEKKTYDSLMKKEGTNEVVTITKAANEVALDDIKAEPKVKEAFLNDAGVLYVSVLDDGTKRDGYAEYLTGVLASHRNISINKVKVVKFGSTKAPNRDNAYGVLLGEADCK